jgi:hypothetical protein
MDSSFNFVEGRLPHGYYDTAETLPESYLLKKIFSFLLYHKSMQNERFDSHKKPAVEEELSSPSTAGFL